MDKVDPIDLASGNTKQTPLAKRWCFTLNNYSEEEYDNIVLILEGLHASYIIGEEVGSSGTEHLQGYIELPTKKRLYTTKGESPLGMTNRIHWEVAKGNRDSNLNYCSKEGKFRCKGFKIKKPLVVLKEDQLYGWQKEIEEIIKGPIDDRKIYWFWEEDGNKGKTTYAKYLCCKYGAILIEGKKNDILYCASEFESEVYLMDIPRTIKDYVSYEAIEKIKNGFYMVSKYESKPIIRNPPHFLVFANFEPDQTKLSADRWVIKKL